MKAVPATPTDAVDFDAWLAESTGLAKGKITTASRMAETRGED
jgi:hypothetical protein